MAKHPRFSHLVLAGVALHAALFAGTALLLLAQTENPDFRAQIRLAFTVAAFATSLFLVILFSGLHAFLFKPLDMLRRDIRILSRVNPGYRLDLPGTHLLGDIPEAVTSLGQALLAAKREVAEAIAASSRDLEDSRNRLETILTATREGIIVCDDRARILFYNPAAKTVFQDNAALGIGRSLYQLCAPSPIENSLAVLRQRRLREAEEPAAEQALSFVCSTLIGTMIRCGIRLLPAVPELSWAFLLTCEDVSAQASAQGQRENLLRAAMQQMRTTVTSLGLQCESLEMLPDMEPDRRAVLERTLAADARSLTGQFALLARAIEEMESPRLLVSDVFTEDAIACVARRLAAKGLRLTQAGDPLWVRADIHTLLLLLEFLALRIRAFSRTEAIEIETLLGDRRVYFNFFWPGNAVPEAEIRQWKAIRLDPDAGQTVADLLEESGSEVWSSPHETPDYAILRFPMPCSSRQWAPPQPRLPARPVYTDFVAYEVAGERTRLSEQPLSHIPFVVFDTETTGLDPQSGDAVVSLAGVKIINRGIIVGETFDRLVNPGRSIPAASVKFHGITDGMVRDMPPLEAVLPLFHAFVGDAVLVGHNAAFDMRFLAMQERRAGVTLQGPVLDTLTISRALHGHTPGHSLDAVARRLGVEIRGRHTALGDALITAQVFIKFLYLLEGQGLVTLGQLVKELEAFR